MESTGGTELLCSGTLSSQYPVRDVMQYLLRRRAAAAGRACESVTSATVE